MNRKDRRAYAATHQGWTPWEKADIPPPTEEQIRGLMQVGEVSRDTAEGMYFEMRLGDDVWFNNRYQVNIRRIAAQDDCPAMIHLSIKRRDKQPVGVERFRDFQRIKNELVGEQNEAVELYPAEEFLADSANQYHLWVFADPERRFPFGFRDRRFVVKESHGAAVQRPFE